MDYFSLVIEVVQKEDNSKIETYYLYYYDFLSKSFLLYDTKYNEDKVSLINNNVFSDNYTEAQSKYLEISDNLKAKDNDEYFKNLLNLKDDQKVNSIKLNKVKINLQCNLIFNQEYPNYTVITNDNKQYNFSNLSDTYKFINQLKENFKSLIKND